MVNRIAKIGTGHFVILGTKKSPQESRLKESPSELNEARVERNRRDTKKKKQECRRGDLNPHEQLLTAP